MQKALIASTVVLALLLGVAAWRFMAKPPPPPVASTPGAEPSQAPAAHGEPSPAAAAETGRTTAPTAATDTGLATAPTAAAEAGSSTAATATATARSATAAAHAPGQTSAPAVAAGLAATPPARKATPPRPEPEPARVKTRLRAQRQQPDPAAMAAIFGERPASDGSGGGARVSTLPPPPPAVRGHAVAPTTPHAAPQAAVHATAHATVRAHASGPAAVPAPIVAAVTATASAGAAPAADVLPGGLSGTLRDGAGAPIAGAPIMALSPDGEDASETLTDDDGFYLLAAVRPGRHLVFTGLGTPLSARIPVRAVEVPAGAVVRTELREPASGTAVTIQALDAAGRPLRAQVLLVAGVLPAPLGLPSLLRADAILLPDPAQPTELRRVPAGAYTLVVLPPGDAAPRAARRPVSVSGQGTQRIVLKVPADLAELPVR